MLEKLEHDRDALAQARDGRLRTEKELTESRNLLELARQAERLRTDRAVIAERYERLRQAADAQKRLQDLEAMPERPMSALRDQLDRMRTMQSRVSVMQETLHDEVGPEVEPDEPEPAFLNLGILTAACLGMGLALVVMGGLRSLLVLILFGAIGLAVGAFIGTRFWERRAVALNVRRLNQSRERDRTIRRQTRVGTEEGLRVASSAVQNILRELGVADITAAEKLLSGEQSRRQEIATLQVQVAALLAGHSPGAVEELRDRAAIEIEQKSSALESLGPLATDARSRERLEAEVRDRHAALERARDAEAAAAARVDANPVDAEQVAGEAERLVTWREQLGALQHRVRVYEKTLAMIQAAESGTMRKATRFLEHQVGRDIGRLTAGRYRRVAIDDQTLDISVWAAELGDWVSATRLSKGTVDQIFLAARMGLVRLVTQGRRPPLILDDPFVTFDDARASRAALLLRELSSDFQVIYLACSNRYDGLADSVVALPGPTDTEAAALARATSANVSAQPTEGEADAAAPATAQVGVDAEPAEGETAVEPPPDPLDAVETPEEPPAEATVQAVDSPPVEPVEPAEPPSPQTWRNPRRPPRRSSRLSPSRHPPSPADPPSPRCRASWKRPSRRSPELSTAPVEPDEEADELDGDEEGERLVVVLDPGEAEPAEGAEDGDGWHETEPWLGGLAPLQGGQEGPHN